MWTNSTTYHHNSSNINHFEPRGVSIETPLISPKFSDICDKYRDFLDDHRRLFKAILEGIATRVCQQFSMKCIKNKYSSLRAMYRKQRLIENSSGQGPSKWHLMSTTNEIFGERPIINNGNVFSEGAKPNSKLIKSTILTSEFEYSAIERRSRAERYAHDNLHGSRFGRYERIDGNNNAIWTQC